MGCCSSSEVESFRKEFSSCRREVIVKFTYVDEFLLSLGIHGVLEDQDQDIENSNIINPLSRANFRKFANELEEYISFLDDKRYKIISMKKRIQDIDFQSNVMMKLKLTSDMERFDLKLFRYLNILRSIHREHVYPRTKIFK